LVAVATEYGLPVLFVHKTPKGSANGHAAEAERLGKPDSVGMESPSLRAPEPSRTNRSTRRRFGMELALLGMESPPEWGGNLLFRQIDVKRKLAGLRGAGPCCQLHPCQPSLCQLRDVLCNFRVVQAHRHVVAGKEYVEPPTHSLP
jgi:hypothetical protein